MVRFARLGLRTCFAVPSIIRQLVWSVGTTLSGLVNSNPNRSELNPAGGMKLSIGEFDPGSERTLAAWIRHASRTGSIEIDASVDVSIVRVANG